MLGGQFGAFWGLSVCSAEGEKVPFLGVVNLERYRLVSLSVFSNLSSSLEEFSSHEKAKAAGLSFHNGELYLKFPFCPCPMLAGVDKLETNTWCQCTTGYSKVIFEKAFGCNVDVELLKSVKMGDDICLMKIIPLGTPQFPA